MSTRAQVTAVWQIPGPKLATINLDFESTGTDFTSAQGQALANAAILNLGPPVNLTGQFSNLYSILRTECVLYDVAANPKPPPAPPFRRLVTAGPFVGNGPVAGTRVTSPLPPNVAVCITFRTNLSSRRTRGRVYFMGLDEGQVLNDGQIAPIDRGNLQQAFTDWVGAIENATGPPVIARHIVLSLMGGTSREVTVYQVRTRVDTQRRRLLRSLDSVA